MKRNFILMMAAPLLGVIFLLPSCESDPDSPGKEFMPDMYRSPAIEAYVDYGEIRGRENKELKMVTNQDIRPDDSPFDCEGCGS